MLHGVVGECKQPYKNMGLGNPSVANKHEPTYTVGLMQSPDPSTWLEAGGLLQSHGGHDTRVRGGLKCATPPA